MERFEAWFAIAIAFSVLSKVAEWVLRIRYRRQAMRGFRSMERLSRGLVVRR